MAGLDFFVEVVVTGAVCGMGVDSSPEAVARSLGDDFAENRDRRRLWRDYGLVEFFWSRRSGAEEWEPAGFTVQVHRLVSAERPDRLAGGLARRYGEFEHRLPFAVLDAELRRLGYQLTELGEEGEEANCGVPRAGPYGTGWRTWYGCPRSRGRPGWIADSRRRRPTGRTGGCTCCSRSTRSSIGRSG